MQITKKTTDNKDLVFIGKESGKYGEEYYLELKDNVRGWSFMGLRPQTENELREYEREQEPQDMLGLTQEEFNNISNYFDFDKFKDDMENGWLERHDSQAEREENGETLYLGFGSGQDIFHYFKEHKITSFDTFCNHFDEIGIDKETFNKVYEVIKKYRDNEDKGKEFEKMKLALNFQE